VSYNPTVSSGVRSRVSDSGCGLRSPGSDLRVAQALRSFYLLLQCVRFYQKRHPRVEAQMEAAEVHLRFALEATSPLVVHAEGHRILFQGRPLADPRGELKQLAAYLAGRAITGVTFLPSTNLGELMTVAELLSSILVVRENGQVAGEPLAHKDWAALLAESHVQGIRFHETGREESPETPVMLLVTALLARQSGPGGERPTGRVVPLSGTTPSLKDLLAAFRLLAGLTKALQREPAEPLRLALADADPSATALLAAAITSHPPQPRETLAAYAGRLAEATALDAATVQFQADLLPAAGVREFFLGLVANQGVASSGADGFQGLVDARWGPEAYAEYLHDCFWEMLPAEAVESVLRSRQAWCTAPAAILKLLEKRLRAGAEREARLLLLSYARCAESADASARRAVAAGLMDLLPAVARLWPPELQRRRPDSESSWLAQICRPLVRALVRETVPETAGMLAAALDHLVQSAIQQGDCAVLGFVLDVLEHAPRRADGESPGLLARELLRKEDRWQALVAAGLSADQSEGALPRILGRQPERLLDSFVSILAAPEGAERMPGMTRLVQAIGEPMLGALAARLFDPRTLAATAAVKLLAAAAPERLLADLPRALPNWDWSLQDMAVSDLARNRLPNHAAALLEALPHAHRLVVPLILDEVGLARLGKAVPTLVQIASGRHEHGRDLFVRIKAVEALGRVLAPDKFTGEEARECPAAAVAEAMAVLRGILRRRNGLAHVEPAPLRAAAEESLALVEHRPSSARVRAAQKRLARAGSAYLHPRRYLRVPLSSPLAARVESSRPAAARVRTISLGGAFLESARRLAVGETLRVEIRAGLRRIHGTAVVRNVAPTGRGGGIEFVHMRGGDRERLRRLVSRLLRE